MGLVSCAVCCSRCPLERGCRHDRELARLRRRAEMVPEAVSKLHLYSKRASIALRSWQKDVQCAFVWACFKVVQAAKTDQGGHPLHL